MCGISGIYNYAGQKPVDEEIVRRMTGLLSHRGPDDLGFHFESGLGLGHRRLSVIDVAGGHQPMFNEDETVAVIFNGEIYNYQQLAGQLENRGHSFYSNSDTETIVHLYEEYGETFVNLLHGMFAVAVWDGRKRKLILARDRIGKKPLYYADFDGCVTFGSELKAVIENPAVPRRMDIEALADYFTYQYIPAPKTIYRGIRKVRAGHYLVIGEGGLTERCYWDLDFEQVEERSEEEWCWILLESLSQAVDMRLASDVPLGAFLSGGVDSSAVVAIMSRLLDSPVMTATVGFNEEKYSEAPDARRFAESLGAEHYERIVTPDAAGIIEKLAWHFDEPFADASAIPTYYLSQAARESVKVVLSGDGGDENFAGYRRYAFDAIENRVRDLAPIIFGHPIFRAFADAWPKADWMPQPLRAKATLKNLSTDPSRAYFNSVYGAMAGERDSLLGKDLRKSLNGYDPFELFDAYYRRPRNVDPIARAQYVDIKTYLSDDILTKVDRASMAVSLEVRCPLLDHQLMTLAARIPSRFKLQGREGKHIFKRAVRGLLPPEVLSREKKGFVVPLAEWLRRDLKSMANGLLFDPVAADDLLDRDAVAGLWKNHQSGLRDFSRPLWSILVFRLWQKTFKP